MGKQVRSGTKAVDRSQTKAIKENSKAIAELQAPVEKKFFDTKFTYIAQSASNSSLLSKSVVAPPVWDTTSTVSNANRINSREGNKITARSLTVDAFLVLPGTGVGVTIDQTLSNTIVRVMAVQYPQNCGGYELQDILQTGTSFGGYNAATSFLKIDASEKYRVLFDRTIPLTNYEQMTIANGFPFGSGEKYRVKCSFRHKFTKAQQEIAWEDTSVASSAIQNDVRLWVFIDDVDDRGGVALTNAARPALVGTIRFRYNDL